MDHLHIRLNIVMTRSLILIGIVGSLILACSDSSTNVRERFLRAESIEELQIESPQVKKLGKAGIPIYLEAISENIVQQDNLLSYGKLISSLNGLNELSDIGIYSTDSLPALFDVLKKQRSISDSLITAELIKKISGIDIGYDEQFIKSYSYSSESERQEMISRWEKLVQNGR